ncbi:MAG: S41 family peptidase [Bacteroidota bacterium]
MKNSILLLLIMSFSVYGQMPEKLSKAEKVYGLSRFWQEVNYNFVYLNKVDRKAWEEEYIKMIPEVQETKNDYEYYRLLAKFSAFLKDGHTNIYAYKEIWEQMNDEFTTHKLLLTGIDGKAIIIGINQSKKDELPLGTEVVKVNGLPTRDYLESYVTPYISSSTEYVLKELAIRSMFNAPKGSRFDVEFKLPNARGGSSDIGKDILEYLTKDSLLYGSRSQSRMHISTLKAWGQWTGEADTLNNAEAKRTYLAYRDELYHQFPYNADTVELNKKRIVVPTALLISMNTASAAEDFLIYADNQEHMIKIGEPTFGSTGQPYHFEMPGGGFARVCTKKDTYANGKEFVGIGVLPDIEVKKNLADFLENNDPVLKAAVKYLEKR